MEAFVLDSSIAMNWLFADERREDCNALRAELTMGSKAYVPKHWAVEVANGIVMGERRSRISPTTIQPYIEMLDALQIEEDRSVRAKVFSDALSLARAHQLTVYDAAYLELALRLGTPLASLDSSLRRAAKDLGVGVVPERE